MSALRFLLLWCYYYASIPLRRAADRARRRRGSAPVVVLFYHRIADDRANPWTTSNRAFRRHVEWLAARFDLLSLAEAQRRIRAGYNPRPAVCITFDDGYAENLDEAIPLLIQRRVPCTYFVTLAHVLQGRPFDHDLARGDRFPPNTVAELRNMAETGIEIGAHSYGHPDLAGVHSPQQLRREIVTVRHDLESLLGQPVRYFAFPFGQRENLTPQVFRLARQAGYHGVCSAYGGYNFPGEDPFHLHRFHGDEQFIRLKNVVTVDPRLLRIPRLDYHRLPADSPAADNLPEPPAVTPETGDAGELLSV